jgi:hypothetical protein
MKTQATETNLLRFCIYQVKLVNQGLVKVIYNSSHNIKSKYPFMQKNNRLC